MALPPSSSSYSQFHAAMAPHVLTFLFYLLFNGASGTTITVVNDCDFTVWPGILDSPVLNVSGFELEKGARQSFEVLGNWSGTIWGRTGCTFNGSGHGSCVTGDCGGEMECNGRNYTQHVTILELDVTTGDHFYNVSLMKGFNLPMIIEPSPGDSCLIMGCVNNLNQRCPPELQLEGGGGCKSACQLYDSPEYCCLNSIETNCSVSKYGRLFESACPKTVTYETNDLGIYTCRDADYTVRFCPPSDTFSTTKLDRLLQYGDQLVSKNGKFELYFYTYDTNSPYNSIYLAISCLTNDQTVWVANPNTPIISTLNEDIFLSIDPNTGNLIVTTSEQKTLMRITDVEAGLNPNVTATLEDNGNFRLINETNKRVLWESFDHPTDVLLPGMKLGYDLTTGHNWTLTSSLSEENTEPAGAFTLSWEPTEQRLVIQRRNQPYWTSGKIKDQQFPYLFELNSPNSEARYKLTSVYNNTVGYFSYSVDQDLGSEDDDGRTPMWRLKNNGQIEDLSNSVLWTPEFCYGLESNMGCMEDSTLLQCRGEKNSFIHQYGSFDPHMTSTTTEGNSSLSISDCFVKCWNECDCVGFNSSNTDGTGCTILKGSNSFSLDPRKNSTWAYVIISQNPNNPTSRKKDKNKMKLIWILIGSTIPLLILCLGLLWCGKKRKHRREEKVRRKRDEYFLELTASESFKDVHQLEGNGGKGSDLLVFSVASIMAATNNFSIENKLGQGGFGPVYKGKLTDGREIAIKRLSRTSGQGLSEFKNELILISKLQHTNLVRVHGCCIHGIEKMLIYEYMPNKSLDFFLFDETRKAMLDWPKRFSIIEGIAQGLLYLHKYSRMRVIHRDLKASNILLDENMNPKISDFGMARIFKENEVEAMTNRVVGTFGYMPPEYVMGGTFSVKSDIFSFGVLILEIVTGRKNSSFARLDGTSNLIGYAWELWQRGDALELKDPMLGSTCDVQQFLRTVHVALLCVQDSAMDRPTTSDMISMLLNDTILLPTPNTPPSAMVRAQSMSTSDERKPKPIDLSINNISITVMDGR